MLLFGIADLAFCEFICFLAILESTGATIMDQGQAIVVTSHYWQGIVKGQFSSSGICIQDPCNHLFVQIMMLWSVLLGFCDHSATFIPWVAASSNGMLTLWWSCFACLLNFWCWMQKQAAVTKVNNAFDPEATKIDNPVRTKAVSNNDWEEQELWPVLHGIFLDYGYLFLRFLDMLGVVYLPFFKQFVRFLIKDCCKVSYHHWWSRPP